MQRYLRPVQERIIALPYEHYEHWFTLHNDEGLEAKVGLPRAAHLLGSAYVEVDVRYRPGEASTRIVFSGEHGAPGALILKPCVPPRRADILVLESTTAIACMETAAPAASAWGRSSNIPWANNGTVLIPAFSVSRTQELLYELEGIIHSKKAGHHRRSRVPVGAGHPRENLEATPNDQIEPDWPRLPIILD